MTPRIGALVSFASDVLRTVEVYRLLGLPLDIDVHEGDTRARALRLRPGRPSLRRLPAEGASWAPALREAGWGFPDSRSASVEEVLDVVRSSGAPPEYQEWSEVRRRFAPGSRLVALEGVPEG